MKKSYYLLLTSVSFLLFSALPIGAQVDSWDFVYDGDRLPEDLIKMGAPDWKARSSETNGMPSYESILSNNEAQIGGIWSRRDDNSVDPNAAVGASKWARGYTFGNNIYSQWTGKMTLVLRIKDLGTDNAAGKSVVDLTNSKGDFWTLGQIPAGSNGPAGWLFGQTNDRSGSVGKGSTDVHTGGNKEWVIIRINVIDEIPGDGQSRIIGWQNGKLVYDTIWKDDISVGEFGEIAFRRTSSGNQQHMEINWVRMSFKDALAPGFGPLTPNGGSDDPGWEFAYNGDQLPETLVKAGAKNWSARTDEINGRPKYENIITTSEAQIGGLWSRIDDNSDDPAAPGSSAWARGYLFGNNLYSTWNGRLTLVMRIRDVGTDRLEGKSVLDIMNKSGDFWTLGHAATSADGPAGWLFGQTNDRSGSVGKGLTNVHTGGFGKWAIIRLNVIDDIPGDGQCRIMGWHDGRLVYDTVWKGDIAVGGFSEIAFRRTSGGNQQKMEIDWVRMTFKDAYPPGKGPLSPNGDSDSSLVDGAISMDTFGIIRNYSVPGSFNELNPLFARDFSPDSQGVPSQFNIFYLGFDAYRDLTVVANDQNALTGVIALDKYAGIHTLSVVPPGIEVTGAGKIVTGSAPGPSFDYYGAVQTYNKEHAGSEMSLPYFPMDLNVEGPNDGVARKVQLAVDWRSASNAFQGFYLLDAYAGVHYFNNPEVLALLNNNPGEAGEKQFFDIFGFRNYYRSDYAGKDTDGKVITRSAPYFYFVENGGLPIARDLEVMVRYETVTTPMIADSLVRNQKAIDAGIDTSKLFQPIAMNPDRLDPSKTVFTKSVAVTNGYAILDGFGGIHSMIEDKDGNAVPAPWENAETGLADPSVNAPYFANPPFLSGEDDFDIAVDMQILPNGQGYCLLTRIGEVYVVNAIGKTAADNFVEPGIEKKLPIFGFDAARALKLVPAEDGKVAGIYVLDRFGTIHSVGQVPKLPSETLFFPTGYARDLELSPYMHPVTSPY